MALDVRGETLGRFELLERLGIGGMAEVFLAQTEGIAGFKKRVVIKRLLPDQQDDPKLKEMFFDEARLAARLAHPNICQVFDLGEVDGTPYIAMEHVPGVSLNRLLQELKRRGAAMPLPAALRVVSQLLEALSYAHTMTDEQGRPLGIIHRDVTPSNVMITPQGSVKLVDFGIARAADRRARTRTGFAMGKLGFMAPEQLRSGELDLRVDIFGAGVTLYLMETGRLPVEANHPDLLLRRLVLNDWPRPETLRTDLPAGLSRITCRALAPEVDARYPTALDMLGELEAFAAGAGLSMGPHALIALMQARTNEPTQPEVHREGSAVTKESAAADTRPVRAPAEAPPAPSPVPPDGPESITPTSPSDALQSQVTPAASAVAGLLAMPETTAPDATAMSTSVSSTLPVAARRADRRPLAAALAVLVASAGLLAVGLSQHLSGEPAPPPPPPAPVPVAARPAAPAPAQEPEEVVPLPPPPPPEKAAEPAPAAPRAAAKPRASGGTGLLRVESARPATVRLLGRDLGATPTTLTLPPGPHRVQLVYEGGELYEAKVTVVEDRETLLTGPDTAR